MKKMIKNLAALLLALSLFTSAGLSAAQSQVFGQCLDNRSINASVASGQILALPQIAQRAGVNPAEILNTRVCRIAGQPYYVIDTLDAYGQTQNHILRATDGAPYTGG